jgi:TIGR03009 family protein
MSKVSLFAAAGVLMLLPLAEASAQPLLPPAQQPPAAQQTPAAPQPPADPLPKTAQEQQQLDDMLRIWQQTSAAIATFSCEFTLWEYDPVFGPQTTPKKESKGEIKYARPDKGMYHVTSTYDLVAKTTTKDGEHWVSDGAAIFEFKQATKELIERRLPPELQGKAISDGPLPFVFGVDANKMKQRYWMQIITPPDRKGEIWLVAYPRKRQDAANFQRVEIILSGADLLPQALQMYEPNGVNRKVYAFASISKNNPLHRVRDFFAVFVAPQTPGGWKRVVEEPNPPQSVDAPGAQQLNPAALPLLPRR